MRIYTLIILAILMLSEQTFGQSEPTTEFRSVWISTVSNLDWPKSDEIGDLAAQKAELIRMLELYADMNLNAVFLQVRPECDAFYNSSYEPWSRYLTGTQGQDPAYDPLAFAIEEAHKLGLEIHAWLNPYRVNASTSDGGSYYHSTHVAVEHPEWVMEYDTGKKILNPGIPDVSSYIGSVVKDIVSKYAVDGIHFDDYFYAYGGTPDALDQTQFDTYGGGLTRDNWRRQNINRMIDTVYKAITDTKSWVKFGVSPFGIYKSGVPSGIVGMDAYSVIYCDPLAWLQSRSVDYLTPQLYWPTGGAQDFETLVDWWAQQCKTNSRHLYAGQGIYRLADNPAKTTSTNSNGGDLHELKAYFDNPSMLESSKGTGDPIAEWTNDQIGLQIDLIRDNIANNALGSVFFRANDFDRVAGLSTYLKTNKYTQTVSTPVMDWKNPAVDDIIVDYGDEGYFQVGDWVESTYSTGFIGTNYFHDGATTENGWSVTYTPAIVDAGNYEVFIYYIAGTNRASNVPVDINHADGKETVIINQQENDRTWLSLGTYTFETGSNGSVVIRNDEADNVVIADAIKFSFWGTVEAIPVADFIYDAANITEGQSVAFTNQSTNNPTSWEWTFEGGTPATSSDENPVVTYNQAGTYDVTLTVENSAGSDTYTISNCITVISSLEAPVAAFSADVSNVLVGDNVQFSDLSTNEPTSWEWSFPGGEPETSSLQNPVVKYSNAGLYNVSLTVTNSAGSDSKTEANYLTVTETVQVPVAAFSASKTTIYVGESVSYFDESTKEPTTWDWVFQGGTPVTSQEKNPMVTYNTVGVYSVQLTVTNDAGSDVKQEVNLITVEEKVGVENTSNVKIELYPNPVSGELFIKGITNPVAVEIFDMIGRKVLQQMVSKESAMVQVSSLKEGLYLVKIDNQWIERIRVK